MPGGSCPSAPSAARGQTIEAEVCSLPERTQYGYRCVTLLQGNRMQLYLRNAPEDAALGDRVRVTADVTETREFPVSGFQ